MSLKYEISNMAKQDLEEIWVYTALNWSTEQANQYYHLIIDAIKQISQNPLIGISIAYIKENHRIHPTQSHLIIYKVDNNILKVDRILHSRMDVESNLTESPTT